LNKAVWWFSDCLRIVLPDARFGPIVEKLEADSQFSDFAASFLQKVGTGISRVGVQQTEVGVQQFPSELTSFLARQQQKGQHAVLMMGDGSDIRLKDGDSSTLINRRVTAYHSLAHGKEYGLAFGDESDGTRRLLELLPVLHTMSNQCRVFVIDELDRSLHPLLSAEFVRFFADSCQGCRSQLIITTHDTHLLNQDLLRRDEIWFVEKDSEQQSVLTSLVDYSVRNDLRIERGYLAGRFGAIPVIGDLASLREQLDTASKE
jgi:uncharacterized protein